MPGVGQPVWCGTRVWADGRGGGRWGCCSGVREGDSGPEFLQCAPPPKKLTALPRGWECRNRRDLPPNSKGPACPRAGGDVAGALRGVWAPGTGPRPPHCVPRPLPCPRSNTPGRTNTTVERLISGGWPRPVVRVSLHVPPPELHRRERLGTGPVPDLDTWRLKGITKVYLRTGPVPLEWPGTGGPRSRRCTFWYIYMYIYILAKV